MILHSTAWRGMLVLTVWLALVALSHWTSLQSVSWALIVQWVLWIVAVCLFYRMQLTGPGYLLTAFCYEATESTTPAATTTTTKPVSTLVTVPYARHCSDTSAVVKIWTRSCLRCDPQRPRPLRCGHCRLCGACVAQLDHHCLIFGCCIGRDNVRYFIAMLWVAMVALVLEVGWTVQELSGEGGRHDLMCLLLLVVSALSAPFVMGGSFFYGYLYGWLGVTYREWQQKGEWVEGYELCTRWSEGPIPRPYAGGSCWENVNFSN